MDLAYLRAHPERLATLLTHQRIRETPVSGGSICQARRITLDDGASLFMKFLNDPTDDPTVYPPSREVPAGFFEAEAAGLRWLGEAGPDGGAAVPEVYAGLPGMLLLQWVEPGPPTAAAAERFGRALAITHQAGATGFGAPWPGFIGSLVQPNAGARTWAEFFAERRLRPHLRAAELDGALGPDVVALVDRVLTHMDRFAPPPEPPARLHGDLWPGNVLWGADGQAYLIDPSAQGGHRETDLANLALFGGAPFRDRIEAAYQEVWPLADGWRQRRPLHQLHLLLVHAALFGSAYQDAVASAARAVLR